ncbi:hypothetical protein AURDEDRAFT_176776 [Auricularia subglabra TFB-10046 SS5]|uniref:Uncharacterized protein n=1 Tax=Auricularia subglabra (strain TFB-10046 / SS5) TaxID=717982 RepID=J0D5T9_AURST|nr:hypothetical protein AURDEDRAFT_176776 [Auricularia subglabra TFB-10046 SS5]
MALIEEQAATARVRRRWYPRRWELEQVELRREFMLHSINAACAVECAMDSLDRISAALRGVKRAAGCVEGDATESTLVAVNTLKMDTAALGDANEGFRAMIAMAGGAP